MLSLKNIVKDYIMGDSQVRALKGVSIDFRKSEFVSILGQSGCGKTTLLNIIGGLDKYTLGDLVINGTSTKNFKDKDWDTYRNHTIGFVFQSYNLIPHQTVLENVELALTLSGVSKKERRERAKEALKQVGLQDQIKKNPNQLSGGQMQRVAIARALVNDPDIILADEPTGALDSETSVQVMEILKEISHDKLIIMVTHNPELAKEYSSRIIKLFDGKVIDDSNPFVDEGKDYRENNYSKKTSMSFKTATSLSLKNLITKKGRTILTSFAGSIGIIGIATVLSMSSGFNAYIAKVEEDTLSTYPITIQQKNVDMSSIISLEVGSNEEDEEKRNSETLYVDNVMSSMINSMVTGGKSNDLKSFKSYIEDNKGTWDKHAYIKYGYGVDINVYASEYTSTYVNQLVPFTMGPAFQNTSPQLETMMNQMPSWSEMIDNPKLIESQYDVISGYMPTSSREVCLVVDKNNSIKDYSLSALGLKSFAEIFVDASKPKEEQTNYKFDFNELIGKKYKVLPSSAYYNDANGDGIYEKADKSAVNVSQNFDNGNYVEVTISGVLRLKDNATAGSINGVIGYHHSLVEDLINLASNSKVVKAQEANPEVNVLTGSAFNKTLLESYESNLQSFGKQDLSNPSVISIYPKSFEDKDIIEDLIETYNSNNKDKEISYTDYIGLMMSSISTIINAISYVLIGFVSISLVVSSIMIGIITYISVLERTKEIGILRAIGASKKDISRVFNAETLLIGLTAGVLGILVTLGIDGIINIILASLVGIHGIAKLPLVGAIILILISVVLTVVAGSLPSLMAAKKDPVIALRSE